MDTLTLLGTVAHTQKKEENMEDLGCFSDEVLSTAWSWTQLVQDGLQSSLCVPPTQNLL